MPLKQTTVEESAVPMRWVGLSNEASNESNDARWPDFSFWTTSARVVKLQSESNSSRWPDYPHAILLQHARVMSMSESESAEFISR